MKTPYTRKQTKPKQTPEDEQQSKKMQNYYSLLVGFFLNFFIQQPIPTTTNTSISSTISRTCSIATTHRGKRPSKMLNPLHFRLTLIIQLLSLFLANAYSTVERELIADNLVTRFLRPVDGFSGSDPRYLIFQAADQVFSSLDLLRFDGGGVPALVNEGCEDGAALDVASSQPPDVLGEDPALDCCADSEFEHDSTSKAWELLQDTVSVPPLSLFSALNKDIRGIEVHF
ncbi:hypothetical protein HOY80DRAFT_982634 [Tuber brumale]|nr:hypothetical protein HOY80DRAFT_982634 [Tuber brumale]